MFLALKTRTIDRAIATLEKSGDNTYDNCYRDKSKDNHGAYAEPSEPFSVAA